MKRRRSPSPQALRLLMALANTPQAWRHGYELCKDTGLASGTLYPLLIRMAEQGLVEAEWEAPGAGRPPRHAYRLTRSGMAAATADVETRPAAEVRRGWVRA